jgi:hypothetical protein
MVAKMCGSSGVPTTLMPGDEAFRVHGGTEMEIVDGQ